MLLNPGILLTHKVTDVAEKREKHGVWSILNLDVQELVWVAYKTEGIQHSGEHLFLPYWSIPSRREAP